MRFLCILAFTLIISSSSYAQNFPQSFELLKEKIVYQSPNDDDKYVPERTTLIIRPDAALVRGRSAQEFSFEVRGEFSGMHSGNVLISDDNETVIFKPY